MVKSGLECFILKLNKPFTNQANSVSLGRFLCTRQIVTDELALRNYRKIEPQTLVLLKVS